MNLIAAFLLGLAGSLHCALMCGPLVLAIASARQHNQGLSGVLHNSAYHTGRILTYCGLGAVSGLIGAAFIFAGFQRWLSITAGALVLLGTISAIRAKWTGPSGKWVLALKSRFGRLLGNRSVGATVLLGGLNGLLPCGLVYVACASAAAGGGLTSGVATMLAFGLGTAPMLLSIGLAGRLVRFSNPLRLRKVILSCAAAAGILLIVRGLSLGIPYLSPHYIDGQGPVCPCKQSL
jgi:sulfite exporter TauE/SafE